jgi:hypothetical protein
MPLEIYRGVVDKIGADGSVEVTGRRMRTTDTCPEEDVYWIAAASVTAADRPRLRPGAWWVLKIRRDRGGRQQSLTFRIVDYRRPTRRRLKRLRHLCREWRQDLDRRRAAETNP